MTRTDRVFRGGAARLRLLAAALLTVSLLLPPAAPASADSMETYLETALRSSATMRSVVSNLEAARARLMQAYAESGTNVALSSNLQGQHIRDASASTDKATASFRVEASRNVYDDGRAVAAISEAEARVAAAAFRVQEAEQRVLLAGVQAYVAILEGERLLELAESNRSTLENDLSQARTNNELGIGSVTAVAQAESRVAAARSDVARRAGELEVSRSRFAVALGEPPPDKLPQAVGLPLLPFTLAEALDAASESHPQLRALRADLQAAELVLRQAEALDPASGLRIFGYGAASYDSTRGKPSPLRKTRPEVGAGLRFSVPLYDGGAKSSRIRQAELSAEGLRARIETAEDEIRHEVKTSWELLMIAESVIDAGRTRIEAASLALQGIRRFGQEGLVATIDVLDSEKELLDAEVAAVRADYDRLNAAYRLLAATGGLNRDTLAL